VRVKGFYLALTTIAAQVIFPIVVLRLPVEWFGGANGLAVEPAAVLGHTLGTPTDMYYLCLAVILVLGMFAFNLQRSRTGRAFRAFRDNDVVTAVLGINLFRYKVLAFFAGAFFGGIAGSFFAARQGFISPESFVFMESAVILAIVVLGGMGSQLGVANAAAVKIGGTELLRELDVFRAVFGPDFDPAQYRMLLFGIAMVTIMIWRPRGLIATRTPSILLAQPGAKPNRGGDER
jgi:branched-chain amino acid transport system permease protein